MARSLRSFHKWSASCSAGGNSGAPLPVRSACSAMWSESAIGPRSVSSSGTLTRPAALRARKRISGSPSRGTCSRYACSTPWWSSAHRAFSVQGEKYSPTRIGRVALMGGQKEKAPVRRRGGEPSQALGGDYYTRRASPHGPVFRGDRSRRVSTLHRTSCKVERPTGTDGQNPYLSRTYVTKVAVS